MFEVIFLWTLALMFIVFAVVQDIKSREIANWLSFSLIIFALGFRLFYSLFYNDGFSFFLNGLIGLGIFLILGNVFYYSRIFAGGDAKIMIALGPVLPIFSDMLSNIQLVIDFFLVFLFASFVYALLSSAFLCLKHFKRFRKEFSRQFRNYKKLLIAAAFAGLVLLLFGFFEVLFGILGIMVFFISYLFVYSKAIEEACMVKEIKTKQLMEGDWLYSDLKIGKKTIKSSWNGITKSEIAQLRKNYNSVRIKEGIPFSPVFLITFIILIFFTVFGIELWNSFW